MPKREDITVTITLTLTINGKDVERVLRAARELGIFGDDKSPKEIIREYVADTGLGGIREAIEYEFFNYEYR